MFPVSRMFDMTIGHDCHPPQKILTGSPTVFVQGKPVARTGDLIQPHCCGNSCHPSFVGIGSKTVYANMRPVARVTDMANCGSLIMTGSLTVAAG